VRCKVNFWCIEGLAPLAEVIYPTIVDHQVGGLGVDRLKRVYCYRPRYASSGDETVATLPVICGQKVTGLRGAAVGVFGPVGGTGGGSGEPVGRAAVAVSEGALAAAAAPTLSVEGSDGSMPDLCSSSSVEEGSYAPNLRGPGRRRLCYRYGVVDAEVPQSSMAGGSVRIGSAAEAAVLPTGTGLSSPRLVLIDTGCSTLVDPLRWVSVEALFEGLDVVPYVPILGPDAPGGCWGHPGDDSDLSDPGDAGVWGDPMPGAEAPAGGAAADGALPAPGGGVLVVEDAVAGSQCLPGDNLFLGPTVVPPTPWRCVQWTPSPRLPQPPARQWDPPPTVGRPRRSHLNSLLVLLVSVLLVVCSLQGAAATPWQRATTHPPVGGSFRQCPL
jgi:hypothetical protein